MFEEQLLSYGALGLWTATLLYQQLIVKKQTDVLIKNNTEALTKVYAVITKCTKR